MKENKKSCDADFKKKAVFLSFQKETVDDVALKMKISNRTLIQWRKSYIIFGDDFTHLGKTKLSPEEKKIYDLEIKIRKLENEFKIIKGAENFLNKGLPSIYQYIAENEKDYSSYMLCKTLRVHLGTYKKWKNQYISDKQKWKMMVKDEITAIFFSSRKRYGFRRITAELQKSGYQLSSNTVRLYMRELNLSVSVKKHNFKI